MNRLERYRMLRTRLVRAGRRLIMVKATGGARMYALLMDQWMDWWTTRGWKGGEHEGSHNEVPG